MPEVNGSITPTSNTLKKRIDDIAGFMEEKDLGISAICLTVTENKFDPETLSWTDSEGGRHTQKCPTRKIVENR